MRPIGIDFLGINGRFDLTSFMAHEATTLRVVCQCLRRLVRGAILCAGFLTWARLQCRSRPRVFTVPTTLQPKISHLAKWVVAFPSQSMNQLPRHPGPPTLEKRRKSRHKSRHKKSRHKSRRRRSPREGRRPRGTTSVKHPSCSSILQALSQMDPRY